MIEQEHLRDRIALDPIPSSIIWFRHYTHSRKAKHYYQILKDGNCVYIATIYSDGRIVGTPTSNGISTVQPPVPLFVIFEGGYPLKEFEYHFCTEEEKQELYENHFELFL